MSLVVITVFIQKVGGGYSAYSPNLPGVRLTSDTREEVEGGILDEITSYIEGLRERHEAAHRPAVTVAKEALEEKIRCLFTVKPTMLVEPDFSGEPRQCQLKAEKEGLCFVHWRRLYGHAVDQHHISLGSSPPRRPPTSARILLTKIKGKRASARA